MTRLRDVRLGIGLAGILLLGSCATQPQPPAESGPASRDVQSPLVKTETAIRSRTFEAGEPIVFDSVISVFEDLGYAIHGADPNTGLVTAEGTVKGPAPASFGVSRKAVASALVEQVGEDVRVILNFAIRSQYSGAYGHGAAETITVFKNRSNGRLVQLQFQDHDTLRKTPQVIRRNGAGSRRVPERV